MERMEYLITNKAKEIISSTMNSGRAQNSIEGKARGSLIK